MSLFNPGQAGKAAEAALKALEQDHELLKGKHEGLKNALLRLTDLYRTPGNTVAHIANEAVEKFG